jgi:transcriptional regulator with XRE-family HTH domain
MLDNGITGGLLAERSGLSRRYLAMLRYGKASPTLDAMKWIAGAASDILGSRVHLAELFDLDYTTFDDERE